MHLGRHVAERRHFADGVKVFVLGNGLLLRNRHGDLPHPTRGPRQRLIPGRGCVSLHHIMLRRNKICRHGGLRKR
jgi:hypothetical protein